MHEVGLIVVVGIVLLYFVIDRWMVTPKYFAALYFLVSMLILGLAL